MRQEVNRHAMAKGLILGGIFAVRFVVSTFQSLSFITWAVDVVIVFFAYRAAVDCREKVLEGVVSYGRCWWYVLNLFLYSSMVAGVFKYVYLKFIRPEYLTGLIGQLKEMFKTMALSKAEMGEVMKTLPQILTPENMALYSIMGDVMLGVLVGLVIAAIAKRDESYRHE